MGAENKVPEICFEGFRGEWVERKIGDVLTEKKRPVELDDNTPYQLVTVKRRNQGVIPRIVLKGRDILVKTYFEIKAGDYLVSKRQVVHGANGIVPESLDKSVVSNEYLVVIGNKDITTKFWTILSKRTEMHKKFFISSYGVDIEKLVFDVDDWKKRTLIIPKLKEQIKIGSYFQQLDSLIAQHQDKHDKLLQIKKALLEKMFPKQGEEVPELRFKGFSEPWEEREFSTTVARVSTISGKTGLPRVEYEDIISNKGELNKNIYQKESTKIGIEFDKGDVLFGKLRPYLKNWLLPNFKGIAVGDFWVLRANETNSKFIYYLIQTVAYETVANQSSGTKMPRSDWGYVSKTLFSIPKTVTEQTKIGNLFKHLDTLLSQHQNQLKKLKNIKQACLAKMFV